MRLDHAACAPGALFTCEWGTEYNTGRFTVLPFSLPGSRSCSEFAPQQLVDDLGIALALARLHRLTHQEAEGVVAAARTVLGSNTLWQLAVLEMWLQSMEG